jgi:hypothetical protein
MQHEANSTAILQESLPSKAILALSCWPAGKILLASRENMDVKAEERPAVPAGKLWPSKQKPTAGQQGKYERQSRSKTIILMA